MVDMLEPLINAASAWMNNGLPLERLMIIERSEKKAYETKGAFSLLKKNLEKTVLNKTAAPEYDIFISYCQHNAPAADFIHHELLTLSKDTRIFMDRISLPEPLPHYMTFWQYIDCREADRFKLKTACSKLIDAL